MSRCPRAAAGRGEGCRNDEGAELDRKQVARLPDRDHRILTLNRKQVFILGDEECSQFHSTPGWQQLRYAAPMSGLGRLQRWLLRRLAPRVAAASLCLPLLAGGALGPVLDVIIYPHGACCCERAHGRPHHCRCAQPHDEDEADQAHEHGSCASVQWSDGDDEYGPPSVRALPTAVLHAPLRREATYCVPVRSIVSAAQLVSRLSSPPPTPPPIFRAGV